MARQFFALTEDVYVPGRWYLRDPIGHDGADAGDIWRFTEGKHVDASERLKVAVRRPGRELDFTAAGAASTPIISNRVAAVFNELAPADVQTLPVEVSDTREPYFLLVVTKLLDCVDDQACRKVERWGPGDGRPEKVGQYRSVYGLRIDATKTADVRTFRLWGWPLPIIIDAEVKSELERVGIVGGRFEPV